MLYALVVPLSGDEPSTPGTASNQRASSGGEEVVTLRTIGIYDDLRYYMKHTVFKLTFNILRYLLTFTMRMPFVVTVHQ
jgi:hypothetical protein